MVPSLYLPSGIPTAPFEELVHTERERILLELDHGELPRRILSTLCHHFGFDDLLEWAARSVREELPPCRSVVFDEARGAVTVCLDSLPQEETWIPVGAHTAEALLELCSVENDVLLRHHLRTSFLLKETLRMNGRMKEWADVAVQVGMESVKRTWYSEALQLFDAVLETSPSTHDEATLHLSRALCHLKLNHIPEAETALDQAEKLNPDLPLIYYYRGHCEFAQRDYIEAIDLMQKALDMNPEHVPQGDAYFYMGMSHINIMEYDDGLRMMQLAEPFYTPNQLSPVLYYMGVCHFGNNDIVTAYELFQKALAADPSPEDLSSIYLYLGMCHKEQEEYSEALEMLERARDAEEDRLDIHNLMGFCYYKLKQHEKAIESFVRAVEIDPASGIDWANLGVNLRATGDDDKAILLFKKAVSLDPTLGFAWKHLQELTGNKNQ
jgi:tetratricopeptide (TPR) repeat protein